MRTFFVVLVLGTMSGCTAVLAVNSKLECLVPPSAAEGKFPFRITYVNDGVRGVIEDTRICKLGIACVLEATGRATGRTAMPAAWVDCSFPQATMVEVTCSFPMELAATS